jgi:60S ribosome subunit biogenesis protein NIP7
MRQAASVARPNLVSLGTCLGKFSKTGKFRLHITSLDWLAKFAKYKVPFGAWLLLEAHREQVWIKPNGEMPYLYGNHVVKAHLGRITEDTPEHQGVVIFNMSDIPLASLCFVDEVALIRVQGFGVTARSTVDTRKLDPTAILAFNQA